MSSPLTHFDANGQAHMVDVAAKSPTHRIAVASGLISMQASTLELILSGTAKKGDVLGIARIAGIMAAKKTSDLIPLCHPLALTRVTVDFEPQSLGAIEASEPQATPSSRTAEIRCHVSVETVGPTGVEMEALNAVQIALLTIYDMCKAVDRSMVIQNVMLLEKRGGKSGDYATSSPI